VKHFIDSSLVEYGPEAYQVLGGDIVWNPGMGPAPGTVYTIWYQYQPFWYVSQLIHEIRVVGTRDYVSGKAGVSRMPFAAHLTRENVHRTEEQDGTEPVERTQAGPADGGFGVR
jgi:hypothetical protein